MIKFSQKFKTVSLSALLLISISLNSILILKSNRFDQAVMKLFPIEFISLDVPTANYDSLIVSAGLKMMRSKEMVEPIGLFDKIKLKVGVSNNKLRYNYHHAFLLDGLISYAIAKQDSDLLLEADLHLKTLINIDGSPSNLMRFCIIDQVTFGLAAINMYKSQGESRYKLFSDSLYNFLVSKVSDDGILYREKGLQTITDPNQINDALAMTVPFLEEYGTLFKNKSALQLANKQIELFREYAVDKETGIPSHGYNLTAKTKTGAANWGRGIGWYALSMAYCKQDTTQLTNLFINSLSKLEMPHGGYSQFPGDPSNIDAIDSSASALIYYFLMKKGVNIDYKKVFMPITTTDGYIGFSSGETGGLNKYSDNFGESELTQGVVMKLIALQKVNE